MYKIIANNSDKKVLVVDDYESVRKMVGRMLSMLWYECIYAEDGIEASIIYVIKRDNISVVLTDFNMPGANGLDLIKALRHDLESDVTIIGMSGKADNRQTMLDAGADYFIDKPFTYSEVTKVFEELGERVSKEE